MRSRDIRAARPDGRWVRYRVYAEMTPPLMVDCARALKAIRHVATYRRWYLWVIRTCRVLVLAELGLAIVVAPRSLFLAIVTVGLAYATNWALAPTAAGFVQRLLRQRPELRREFILAGIVRADVPREPPRSPAEWERRAWEVPGETRAVHRPRPTPSG